MKNAFSAKGIGPNDLAFHGSIYRYLYMCCICGHFEDRPRVAFNASSYIHAAKPEILSQIRRLQQKNHMTEMLGFARCLRTTRTRRRCTATQNHSGHFTIYPFAPTPRLGTCLVHAVEELQEDGCEATALAAGGQVTALAELVSERQPFLLHQDLEALQRPVERVTEQLRQRHHLHEERKGVTSRSYSSHSRTIKQN